MSTTPDQSTWTQANRAAWDEIADIRQPAMFPPAPFFAAGGSLLDPDVVALAGPVMAKRLLHLQCATGEDTLSWANQGAQVVGIDISARQIELAQIKAAEAGIPAEFSASDIYALPLAEQAGAFDIVFTGGGVLAWLPDISRWAQIIAALLRPGGVFILDEEHPLASCMRSVDGQLVLEDDYFSRSQPLHSHGWTHFAGGEQATATKFEFQWPLGDIVTALAAAGLRIEVLHELPSQAAWRFKEQLAQTSRLPGQFRLRCRK